MADSDDEKIIEIVDTPTNFRPDLTLLGIDEIDKGIAEDTSETRRILRKARLTWKVIYTTNGEPSGNIEAISDEMLARKNAQALEDKKALLKDFRDPNSDYITGIQLILSDADSMIPSWVLSATQEYREIEKRREADPSKKVRPNLTGPPARCAYIKTDGLRCQYWTSGRTDANGLCRTHLGSMFNTAAGAVERARKRILQSAPRAADVLEEMMDEAVSENVRLRAAEQLLDRAGVRGGIEIDNNVNIEVRPAADEIRDRLKKLQAGGAARIELEAKILSDREAAATGQSIEDAEVIEEDTEEDTEK